MTIMLTGLAEGVEMPRRRAAGRICILAVLLALLLPVPAAGGGAEVIRVGPGRALERPSEAARLAPDGAVVEIDAGVYRGDVAIWTQDRLTLRGVGGLAQLEADGGAAQGKAIWVIKGDEVTVERIGFSGARVPDLNGAGIRAEGRDLTIRDSLFHDNEMGILTDSRGDSHIVIERSEFARNSVDYERSGRLGHNIYIGAVASFTLIGSYVHGSRVAHNVKTRARHNRILYNRIVDDDDTGSSYLIDLADGGDAEIVGNSLRQSRLAENRAMIAYAAEAGREAAGAEVVIAHNTFVNEASSVRFVRNFGSAELRFLNNLVVGGRRLVAGPAILGGNVVAPAASLRDASALDYRLAPGSPAIDAGIALEAAGRPRQEYRHPLELRPRPTEGPPDAGAYEFTGR